MWLNGLQKNGVGAWSMGTGGARELGKFHFGQFRVGPFSFQKTKGSSACPQARAEKAQEAGKNYSGHFMKHGRRITPFLEMQLCLLKCWRILSFTVIPS